MWNTVVDRQRRGTRVVPPAGSLGGEEADFDLSFEELAVGDIAFAIAPTPTPANAFTLMVGAQASMPVELLQVAALLPRRRVTWRYFAPVDARAPVLSFTPLLRGGAAVEITSAYRMKEMLLVFTEDGAALLPSGALATLYAIPGQQLGELHARLIYAQPAARAALRRELEEARVLRHNASLFLTSLAHSDDDGGDRPRVQAAKASKGRGVQILRRGKAPSAGGAMGRPKPSARGAAAASPAHSIPPARTGVRRKAAASLTTPPAQRGGAGCAPPAAGGGAAPPAGRAVRRLI